MYQETQMYEMWLKYKKRQYYYFVSCCKYILFTKHLYRLYPFGIFIEDGMSMNLKKLIQPIVWLTFVFLLYTGCRRAATKYIYMNPQAMAMLTTGPVPEMNTVSYAGLYIEVNIPTQAVQVAGLLSLPGNIAYAFQPGDPPPPIGLEKITDIRIKPLNDYNATYPAFSDMLAGCTFVTTTMAAFADTLSKEEIISNMDHHDDRIRFNSPHGPFYIKLNEPPTGTGEQRFIIELITDKNSLLADTTQPIILTP